MKKSHITGELADAVKAQALREPPETEYDILNLITWASSHLLPEPKQVLAARSVAAGYASEAAHAQLCPLCHRGS